MEGFSLPLRICFLADKILLVLNGISEERKTDEKEREVLKEAFDFFDQVRRGKQLVESLTVDTSLVEASSLYGVALDVLLFLKKDKKVTGKTEKILNGYQKALETITKVPFSPNGSMNSLKPLREFFVTLRTIGLDRIERPMEEVAIIGSLY